MKESANVSVTQRRTIVRVLLCVFVFMGAVAVLSLKTGPMPAKLGRIKYFPALLALNKFCVFLSGDDLDDGMFALGCHLGRYL